MRNFIPMDNIIAMGIEQNAQCLAMQRLKARIIKDGIIQCSSQNKQRNIAKKVIKFTTLLSQKMLNTVKTYQIQQFQKEMQQYCQQQSQNQKTQVSYLLETPKMATFLQQIKKITKKQISNNKKRAITTQKDSSTYGVLSGKSSISTKMNGEISPLGNSKIKEAIESNKKRKNGYDYHVNGKAVSTNMLNLLQKLNDADYNQNLRQRRQVYNEEDTDQYVLGPTNLLKKEKERLSTAFQNQCRKKFRPLGKIYDFRNSVQKESMKAQIKSTKKRKPSIILSSSYLGRASLKLEEGLPNPIKALIPPVSLHKTQQHIVQKRCFKDAYISQQCGLDSYSPFHNYEDNIGH